jgi:hypothetical protein
MRNGRWGESTSGPDWTDLESLLRSIDAMHGGQSALMLSPLGIGSSGGWTVRVCTVWDAVPGADTPQAITTEKLYPCPDCATMEGHIFNLLYRHDFAISEAYMSGSLWTHERPAAP